MIQYEELEYCKIKVHYQADSDLVLEKQDEALRELKKSKPKVPGFREATKVSATKKKKRGRRGRGGRTRPFRGSLAGKMRKSSTYNRALRNTYKKHLEEVVKKELVSEAYDETLFETKMKPVGYPEVVSYKLEKDDFWCDLIFLKKPDFELGDYENLEVPKPHIDKTELEIAQKMLQDLRVAHGELSVFGENDTVQKGDQITVDFFAEVDGKPNEELTKEGFLHTVGENAIPNFDENIIGMKPGEERVFEIEMGDEFLSSLRGKKATFRAKVHMGTKKIPCPLDDSLAEKVGFSTFEELNQKVNGNATAQLKSQEEAELAQQVINRLLEAHDFRVPPFLLNEEAKNIAKQAGAKWEELSDDHKKMATEKAEKSVKLSMILDSIREEEPEATLSDQEALDSIRKEISASHGNESNELLSRLAADGTLLGIIASRKDEATLKWLVSQTNVVE